MRYPYATAVPGAVVWSGSMRGPRIVPGAYKVKLTVGDDSSTRTFLVKKNPNVEATQADLEAQLALGKKIHAKLNATDQAILRLRKVRGEINDYLDRLHGSKASSDSIKAVAKPIVAKLTDIEDALIQTRSHSGEDPLNYPIRLNDKLAGVAAITGAGFARPTQQDYQVFAKLSRRVDVQLGRLHDVLQQQLPKLNRLIETNHIAPIMVPK
jgi:hypothetical protein